MSLRVQRHFLKTRRVLVGQLLASKLKLDAGMSSQVLRLLFKSGPDKKYKTTNRTGHETLLALCTSEIQFLVTGSHGKRPKAARIEPSAHFLRILDNHCAVTPVH